VRTAHRKFPERLRRWSCALTIRHRDVVDITRSVLIRHNRGRQPLTGPAEWMLKSRSTTPSRSDISTPMGSRAHNLGATGRRCFKPGGGLGVLQQCLSTSYQHFYCSHNTGGSLNLCHLRCGGLCDTRRYCLCLCGGGTIPGQIMHM